MADEVIIERTVRYRLKPSAAAAWGEYLRKVRLVPDFAQAGLRPDFERLKEHRLIHEEQDPLVFNREMVAYQEFLDYLLATGHYRAEASAKSVATSLWGLLAGQLAKVGFRVMKTGVREGHISGWAIEAEGLSRITLDDLKYMASIGLGVEGRKLLWGFLQKRFGAPVAVGA